jgi:phage gp29-like protein
MADYRRTPGGLLLTEAQFAELTPARPELREVATTADGRDITRGYVDRLPLLSPQDDVLVARGAGDYAIYDQVLRDDQVSSTLQQRRLAVVSKEWEVLPGGKRRRDKQAADFLSELLDQIRWDDVTAAMLYGVFYGFAVGECLWQRDGARIGLETIRVRDRKRFRFGPDMALKLLTSAAPQGELLQTDLYGPVRRGPRNPYGPKFWAFAAGATHDDEPYGLGLAHWLYWPVLFKRQGIKFWLIFLEKFGQPTGVGHFPVNSTSDERDKLLAAVQAIQTDSGVILPEGMAIELLEAARSGTADYTALLDRMNAAISKVTVGQTMTTDDGSSRAQAEVHLDVREDLVKADSDLVCGSANASWVRWLTDWNFPGAEYPQIWRRIEDEPDLKPQADRDKVIVDMGFRPTLQYITETYGDGWEEAPPPPSVSTPEDDEQAGADTGQEQRGGAQFAEPAVRPAGRADEGIDVVDRYRIQLEQAAGPAQDVLIERIRALLEQSETLEQFEARLASAYDYLDSADLAVILRAGLLAADLAGRFEVSEGR